MINARRTVTTGCSPANVSSMFMGQIWGGLNFLGLFLRLDLTAAATGLSSGIKGVGRVGNILSARAHKTAMRSTAVTNRIVFILLFIQQILPVGVAPISVGSRLLFGLVRNIGKDIQKVLVVPKLKLLGCFVFSEPFYEVIHFSIALRLSIFHRINSCQPRVASKHSIA